MDTSIKDKLKLFISLIENQSVTPLDLTFARIYTSPGNNVEKKSFRFSGLEGFLVNAFARKTKESCLRLYSADSFELLFSVEMYYGFEKNYIRIRPCFYAFEYGWGFIGIGFGDQESAKDFHTSIKSRAPKKEDWEQIMKAKNQEENKKKKKGFFSRLFKDEKEEDSPTQVQILKIQHNQGMSYNHVTGEIDSKNLDPNIKMMLKDAGIKKNDLKNPEIAEEIMNVLVHNTARESMAYPNSGLVPPPPQSSSGLAPPSLSGGLTPPPLSPPQLSPGSCLTPPSLGGSSLSPPPLSNLSMPQFERESATPRQLSSQRVQLMDEIRNGNFKLKKVQVRESNIEVKIGDMRKHERDELAQDLMKAIQRKKQNMGKKALNDSDDDWSDD